MNNFLKKAAANAGTTTNTTAGAPAPKKLGGLGMLAKKPLGAKLGAKKEEATVTEEVKPKVDLAPKVVEKVKETPVVKIEEPKKLSAMEQAKLKMAQAKAKKEAEAKPLEAKADLKANTPVVIEEVKVVEEVKETPATEEKTEVKETSAKKTTPKKATSKAPAPKAEPVVYEPANIEITRTEVDFATAIQDISSGFEDKVWEEQKAELIAKSADIMISPDMNSAGIQAVETALYQLRDSVWVAFADTKTLYESLTNKDTGTIDRVRNLNLRGANAEERKFNATMALIKHITPNGNRVNLLELLDETRSRYNFLKQLMETIDYKCGVCITMLGALKQGR